MTRVQGRCQNALRLWRSRRYPHAPIRPDIGAKARAVLCLVLEVAPNGRVSG